MKIGAYPAYKQSGVEWLGDVPKQWEVKRLKYSASINDEALPETTPPEFELNYVDIGNVDSAEGIIAQEQLTFDTAPSRARRIVRDGDTIVSTVRTYLRAIAPIRNPESNFIVSTGFAVVRPRTIDPHFLSYALRESSFIENVVARSVGVSYPAINASEVGSIAIPLPRPDEQRAIADFLDRETARLDRLVAKKWDLIEKLKEKRIALISRTVTRGLNPNAKLKPSGVEWLGDIPQHWDAKRLKHAALVITGFAFSSDDFTSDGVPVLRIGDIDQEGRVVLSDAKFLPVEYLRRHQNVVVQTNDIVMAMTGATIGKVGRYLDDAPALLNQRVCIFRALPSAEQSFVWYLLNAEFYIEHVVLTAFGGAQPNISDTELLACPVPVPGKAEQHAIADYLDRETAKIDKMMEKVEAAIEKLQEYRTALITAAVTGKIDVRSGPKSAVSTCREAASTLPA